MKKKSKAAALFHKKPFFSFRSADILKLIQLASKTKKKCYRFCSHRDKNEPVHEMVIAHKEGAYIRPHKHLRKPESLLIIIGKADYLLFSEKGKLVKRIEMGDYHSKRPFYQSTRKEIYHSMIVKTPWLVFLEITKGPFRRHQTVFARWSPGANRIRDGIKFLENAKESLEKRIS